MFLETVRSEGLAHLSYIFGDGPFAAVIDPRRDAAIYEDIAAREGARISHIFETHRNEDYVTGSRELARRTGARIFHGKALAFEFGEPTVEGDIFDFGALRLRVLETPGHTYESISLVLMDTSFGETPVGVFTGDALFIGDVGRTDFFPDKAGEVAGLLYSSIFEKLLPLGDHVLVWPAHGAGSVCGSGMADREFSTLGYERKHNPRLQMDREQFVAHKVAERHYQPPYFRKMEEHNLKGNEPPLCRVAPPRPLTVKQFSEGLGNGMVALDIRSPESFAGAFVEGSLAIPLGMLPAFAGWFCSYDTPLGLIGPEEGYEDVLCAVRYLARLGYDQVSGFLRGGLHAWETAGRQYGRIPAVHVTELLGRMEDSNFLLLDVRSKDEYESGHLAGARHIYVGQLEQHLDELPKDKAITTFCGSGRRAIIAASVLKKHGYEEVSDCLGSMSACEACGCPVE